MLQQRVLRPEVERPMRGVGSSWNKSRCCIKLERCSRERDRAGESNSNSESESKIEIERSSYMVETILMWVSGE